MAQRIKYLSGVEMLAWDSRRWFGFLSQAAASGFTTIMVNLMNPDDYADWTATEETLSQFIAMAKAGGFKVQVSFWLSPGRRGLDKSGSLYWPEIAARMKRIKVIVDRLGCDEWGVDGEFYAENPNRWMKARNFCDPSDPMKPGETFEWLWQTFEWVAKQIQADFGQPVGTQKMFGMNWATSQLGKRHLRWPRRYKNTGPDQIPPGWKEQPNPIYGYFVHTTDTVVTGTNSKLWTPEEFKAQTVNETDDVLCYHDSRDDVIRLMQRMA